MTDIKNYEGLYAVTEDGKVWSHKRQKFLTSFAGAIALSKEGKTKKYLVRRLVQDTYGIQKLSGVMYKDITGFEGLYAITEDGRVWSYYLNDFMSTSDNGTGYRHIVLSKNGKIYGKYIHILVAQAFVPNPDNKPDVSHLDESRDNNHFSNLVWATKEENCNMPLHKERLSKSRGTSCKCIETNVTYHSTREAQRQTGICQQSIARCCRGKYKTAGGYHWEFVETKTAS